VKVEVFKSTQDNLADIVNLLIAKRKAKGWTQVDIAKKTKISLKIIKDIEQANFISYYNCALKNFLIQYGKHLDLDLRQIKLASDFKVFTSNLLYYKKKFSLLSAVIICICVFMANLSTNSNKHQIAQNIVERKIYINHFSNDHQQIELNNYNFSYYIIKK
jgi:cytoskeletal protein RodZ